MPNDAKLGLVVGVGVVIVIAVVFAGREPNAVAVKEPAASVAGKPGPPEQGLKGRTTAQAGKGAPAQPASAHRHVVQEGETLCALAERYYGDRERVSVIREANADKLQDGDDVQAGTELLIPVSKEVSPVR